MPSFAKLLTIAASAVAAFAATARPSALHAHCASARLSKEVHLPVDGGVLHVSDYDCAAPEAVNARSVMKRATDVCGELCSSSCNDNAGNLPPVVDDCNKIVNSVAILQGQISPEFTVSGHGAKVLTFQTCSFIFTNTVSTSLTECWSHMVTVASQAGAGCFPPVQPFFSEGLCTGGTWTVAAAHSSN